VSHSFCRYRLLSLKAITYDVIGSLTDSQRKALTHVVRCRGRDNTNHIAKGIGNSQSSVFEALQKLVSDEFMRMEQGKGTEKLYRATNKGIIAAFLLGASFDEIYRYCIPFDQTTLKTLKLTRDLFREPTKRDYFAKKLFEYFIENCFFEKAKKEPMSNQDLVKLQMFMANQAITQFGAVGTIREAIEKYGLKKKVIKDILEAYKNYILKLEKELEEIPDQ
jgi:hypothetical protein